MGSMEPAHLLWEGAGMYVPAKEMSFQKRSNLSCAPRLCGQTLLSCPLASLAAAPPWHQGLHVLSSRLSFAHA